VDRAIERSGYADFWELRARHLLPVETTNYVPIILAMTIMSKNAASYGLTDLNPEPALEYDTVKVSSPTHLALVGDLTDTPVSQLLAMNPALLKNVAPADYELHVPKNAGDQLRTALELFPVDRRASWRMHRVESGETLAGIARQFNTAASSIEGANRISPNGPQAGDRLIIPASFHEEGNSIRSRKMARRGPHSVVAHRGLARGGSLHVAALRGRVHKPSESHVAAKVHRGASARRA
jgi:membrane-bound lytic murein transglycosylase D